MYIVHEERTLGPVNESPHWEAGRAQALHQSPIKVKGQLANRGSREI